MTVIDDNRAVGILHGDMLQQHHNKLGSHEKSLTAIGSKPQAPSGLTTDQ